ALDTNVVTHCGPPAGVAPIAERTLGIDRLIDAPVEKLWRCWTEPSLLMEWFCPKPWRVSDATIDLRPGGVFDTTMRGPEGEVIPNIGQIAALEPMRRIVLSDAYVGDWIPSGKAFLTSDIRFTPEGGKTRYVWRALHWSGDDTKAHEAMGFHAGWNAAADQLEALAKSL
ncbi:MAG: SRPBCC family protein, partial [Parvularculaceae bacterium]|nr:SRPBCC family protein [Parvularculaceae bacterium]